MKSVFALISCILLALAFGPSLAEAQMLPTAEISRVGEATHLEFKGQNQWKYDLKRGKAEGLQTVTLQLPGLAPESVALLRAHKDQMISKVEVNTAGVDNATEVVFHLATDEVDAFDYTSDQPSRLIVDFYFKDDDTEKAATDENKLPVKNPEGAAPVAAEPPKQLPPIKTAKSPTAAGRKPAGDFMTVPDNLPLPAMPGTKGGDAASVDMTHGIFDGGDPEFRRFAIQDFEVKESALIATRRNLYIEFPMLKLDSPHLKALIDSPPVYEIVATDSDENKEARLAMTLFNNKRVAVFMKVAKDFLEKYPNTQYDEIIRYMIADTHYDFWVNERSPSDFAAAMGLYLALTERYPESPLALRTSMLMAYSYVERGDSFAALKTFQRVLRQSKDPHLADRMRISMAEAYLKLAKYDDALGILSEVESGAGGTKEATEAAYRKGDIYLAKGERAEAVKVYRAALRKYPLAWRDFPNAYYNVAEAGFLDALKTESAPLFREALDGYREFLQRFPTHPHAGYALARIGETLDILGADPKRALGAYFETYFRYRSSPGAAIARMRILTRRMPEMKDKELADAMREVTELEKQSASLDNINEFVTLMRADGLYSRKDYPVSTELMVKYFQGHPNSPNLGKIRQRIERNIASQISDQVGDGQFLDALKTYNAYRNSWLKDTDRFDTEYNVGRAFEQAAVFSEAGRRYRDTLNKVYSIQGTAREREKSVFESIPSPQELNLRLARVSLEQKDYARATDYLKAIVNPEKLSEKDQVERVAMAAEVNEARDERAQAIANISSLLETWRGQPALVAPLHLRLARLQVQEKDLKAAEFSVTKILNLQEDTKSIPEELHAQALELKADLLMRRGRRSEAVRTYKELLEQFDGKRPMASVRYRAGKALFDAGDLKGADTLWAGLAKEKTDEVWSKLANEQMQSAKWKGDYKKYIDRIPAMSTEASDTQDAKGQP